MTQGEAQFASDYSDRTTAAVKAVLVEIGQILGSFKGKFAVIGGAVPWLLLGNTEDMPHVGTLDVDIGLKPFRGRHPGVRKSQSGAMAARCLRANRCLAARLGLEGMKTVVATAFAQTGDSALLTVDRSQPSGEPCEY